MIIAVHGGFVNPFYVTGCKASELGDGVNHVFTIDGKEWTTNSAQSEIMRSVMMARGELQEAAKMANEIKKLETGRGRR